MNYFIVPLEIKTNKDKRMLKPFFLDVLKCKSCLFKGWCYVGCAKERIKNWKSSIFQNSKSLFFFFVYNFLSIALLSCCVPRRAISELNSKMERTNRINNNPRLYNVALLMNDKMVKMWLKQLIIGLLAWFIKYIVLSRNIYVFFICMSIYLW